MNLSEITLTPLLFMKHLCLLSLSSFNLEFIVGDILTLNAFLGDVDEADDTTG